MKKSLKRPSLWLMFVTLAVASSQMHPGLAGLIAVVAVAVLLMTTRLLAHWEGGKMLLRAQANGHGLSWVFLEESVVVVGIGAVMIAVLWFIFRHVPWFWFPVSS